MNHANPLDWLKHRFQRFWEWLDDASESITTEISTDADNLMFRVHIHIETLTQREHAFRQRLQRYHKRNLVNFARRQHWKMQKETAGQRLFRLMPAIFVTLGSVIIANAAWPILSYFVFVSPDLRVEKLVSPLPDVPILRQTQTIPTAQAATEPEINPKVIRDNLDYTNLSNWFPETEVAGASLEKQAAEEKTYIVEIPSLDIHNAEVKIGGTNLDNNLIQYPGTADPGELGAPVIFGHSVLRQFYNPSEKNPRRYMSIFSKIMTMSEGEKIYITYDGIRYTYSVKKKVEVKPEDTYILEQEFSAKQLKLVTCVPEGTYLRRGVVLAQLEEIN
ncbi:sortase [Candidatus Woesebacteria bacterium]|nr:sortase [Candidatus Woesebacteria bacterium]MCD8506723.1 sortase [Candidatus Woesebacteria bacterium]MCD8527631.1 sortase [Candidatus Woesebacteria bacterium]MCD8546398.1 sortase [Candidatus Woesebacteria bacterium]